MININNADICETLPEVLKNNKDIYAFAKAFEIQLKKTINCAKNIIIYSNIDHLPESILDQLAYDLKCDWYDKNYNLDTKRDLIKNCIKVHTYKGTVYAVETAVNSIYPCELTEWFEYDGEPFGFKLNLTINSTGVTAEIINKLIEQMNYYKNARSHLDDLSITVVESGNLYTGAGAEICTELVVSEICYLTDAANYLTDENGNRLITAIE